MAGFVSYNEIIDARCNLDQGYDRFCIRRFSLQTRAGTYTSLWGSDGTSGAGATPGVAGSGVGARGGTSYTNAAGSIFLPDQALAQKHLLTHDGVVTDTTTTSGQGFTIVLYDRLTAVSGILTSGATGARNVYGPASLPRYNTLATGLGSVEAWIEMTATASATCTMNWASYTNQDGTADQVGGSLVCAASTLDAGRMYRLPLAAGDTGVKSIETVNVSVAAASGVFNIVLLRPIACLQGFTNDWNTSDLVTQFPRFPRLYDGASLCYMVYTSTAVSGSRSLMSHFRVAYR